MIQKKLMGKNMYKFILKKNNKKQELLILKKNSYINIKYPLKIILKNIKIKRRKEEAL